MSAVPVMTTGATPPPGMMSVMMIEETLKRSICREVRFQERGRR